MSSYLDVTFVLVYLLLLMVIGVASRARGDVSADEYFLGARSLRWPSIAVSTIATNINTGHFLSMAGSAYVFGLAQANFEINAIAGILVAVFVFVPLYLRARVVTISDFFRQRLGPGVALVYAVLMLALYAFMYLGSALFWAGYALNAIFGDLIGALGPTDSARIAWLAVGLAAVSAAYTGLGGLRAVVRTDLLQFVLLVGGGLVVLWSAMSALGGWELLYETVPDHMHLHLPADHDTLPWVGILGMLLLNLNYWGANQVILQRALAAKSLRDAQIGLLVGGFLKYLIVLLIIVPAIALAGIGGPQLDDPDLAYVTLVKSFVPHCLRALILVGLIASLMSTVDSIFNSLATLWSNDIYKVYLHPDASEHEIVRQGKMAIVVALLTGIGFALVQIHVKYADPGFPLTHWFNAMSYYVKNGFVLLIVSAVFLVGPDRRLVLGTFIGSIPITRLATMMSPDMNYLIRTAIVIAVLIAAVTIPCMIRRGIRNAVTLGSAPAPDRVTKWLGIAALASLVLAHVIFH